MLKQIAAVSPELTQFVDDLNLSLSQPQRRHIQQIADGLITIDGDKNLSNLYRHFVNSPCPKSAADTFREVRWRAHAIRVPLHQHLIDKALTLAEAQGAPKVIFLSIYGSFTEKDRHSIRLEAVDWLYDRERSSPQQPVYSKGTVYVMLRLSIGHVSFTVDIQLCLRRTTVRRLNRQRRQGQKLRFRSKLVIATQMLKAMAQLLPRDYQVYVLFDSWYASAKFINWCTNREWHVICRPKSNRQLDRIPVKRHHQRLRHRRYTEIRVPAADGKQTKTYQVRSLTGRLNKVYQPVRVHISKRHTGDKHPRYYGSTDTTLSPQEALAFLGNRWSCEVANWYITEKLGWADCRLWRFESTDKFLMTLWLALAYQEVRYAQSDQCENLAQVIRQHRQHHARRTLEAACRLAMQVSDLSRVLAQFTIAA